MIQSSFFTSPISRHRPTLTNDAPGIAIFVVDDEPIGSRIVYVNDAFVRMSGYTHEQLVGHSALLLAGARPGHASLEAARTMAMPWTRTETKTRPDGSVYRVEVSLEALPCASGRPQHVVLTQRLTR